jgi:hypothetical protein
MATRKLTLPPVCVAVRAQLHMADCGLAALAMALGLPYEQVFRAAPMAAREGLTARQLQSVATKLGARLITKANPDFYADQGVLGLEFQEGPGHWAFLRQGAVIDPADTTIWDVDDYLAHYNATWDYFLVASPALQHGPRSRRHQARLRR